MAFFFAQDGGSIRCVSQVLTVTLNGVQVDGPLYRLILKKEKAHDMDINSVRWCPQVTLVK